MLDKNIVEAKKMLEFAFKYEESFGNFFTLFMKLRINHFITINKDIFTYEIYCKNKKLIDEKYYEDSKFLYEKYVNNHLLINQMEPSLFIITLVPYVFNVSMNLYIKEKNYSFKEISFDLKENNLTNISILYSSYSYHIIENNLVGNNILRDCDLANTLDLNKSCFINFNKNNYITIEDKKCNKCNKYNDSNFIKFLKKLPIINSSICLNCLKNTINEILIKRYEKMISEQFNYLEFYLRDIPLTSNEDNEFIFLSPPEFYSLFECNIYTYFRNLIINNLCDLCRKYKNKIITKECGCKRCLDCAKKEINKNLILTNFDKNYLKKDDFMTCQCNIKNSTIKYSNIINEYLDKNEKMILKEKLDSKIQDQFKNYCMHCGTKLINNNIGSENLPPKTVIVKINEKLIKHYICRDCKGKENSSDICIICEQKHEIEKNKKEQEQEKVNVKNGPNLNKRKKKEDINININNSNNIENKNIKKDIKKKPEKKRREGIICRCIIF
jgi:hypothetical protein